MGFTKALEAPVCAALFADYVTLLHRWILKCDLAPFPRAPLSPFININKRLGVVVVEPLVVRRGEGFLEEGIRHYQFARGARAYGVDTVGALGQLALEVVGVTVAAEEMPTVTHTHNIIFVVIADFAEEGKFGWLLGYGKPIKVKESPRVIIVFEIAVTELLFIPEVS